MITLNYKPVITYWKSSDPCLRLDELKQKIVTDENAINVIRTRNLTDDFIKFILENKNRIFIHLYISGLNQTIFEPNIPTVRNMFYQLKKLFDLGFARDKVVVFVDPIIPNDNGRKILELILRVFSELKDLRLRYMKFNVIKYKYINNRNTFANQNLTNRYDIGKVMQYLIPTDSFKQEYYTLINKYKSIIYVDNGDEPLIGFRELKAFNLSTNYIDSDGVMKKIINYKGGNKYEPDVKIISGKSVRCNNKCLLCPFWG